MALRWLEGFQGCRNSTIFGRLYTVSAGSFTNTLTDEYGRTLPDSANLVATTPPLVGAVANSWIIGFGFQLTNGQLEASPSGFPFVSLLDSVGEQLRLEAIDATSATKPGGVYYRWRLMRGVTEIARTDQRWPANVQNDRRVYFELKATVRTSTNGSFELRYFTHKGGKTPVTVTWDNAVTGINTANQGTDGADRVGLSWNTGSTTGVNERCAYSDLYVCDSTGAKNNDFLGRLYMEAMTPQGDGNQTDWVLAGGAVSLEDAWNEGAATQSVTEDDKRVTSENVGDISLVTMTNLSSAVGTAVIIGMQVRLYGYMDTVGSRDIQFMYRKTTGTPAQVGTGILDLDSTSIVGEADTQENDPNTATDWVLADIQGIELGAEVDA